MNRLLLQAQGLVKDYRLPHGVVHVLRGADLSVSGGESVAIMGQSGSGKSTLLHVLGGLDRPEAGTLFVDGRDFFAMSAGARTRLRALAIGFVFQSFHLLPEMDVAENVLLPSMAVGEPRRIARKRALELLDAVGLADRAAHTPLELSGGEQQRVAIARALINQPRIILADEPTGNLDGDTGTQVLDLLFSLVGSPNRALVVVTHAPQVAARCGRTLELRDGVLSRHEAS
ncbi:MAG: ABC transporter ATP-binding protein [Kiritimatiellia bacterium]|jgi:predicted ABC-type transport system involved in lysophospholipase L1 biosynthesis ATPase subunit